MTKTMAKVWGFIFLMVGVIGFFGNPIVGHESFFHTNALHNGVHLVLGLLLITAARTDEKAVLWLRIVGVIYLVVAALGFFMIPGMGIGDVFGIEMSGSDNWLHLALGVLLLLLGMKKRASVQG